MSAEPSTKRRWRVAVAGLGCENCTFNPVEMGLAAFHPELEQGALQKRYHAIASAPVGTPLDLVGKQALDADFSDLEFVYCCYSRAIPGGPVSAAAFETLVSYIVDPLAAHHAEQTVDAVWLDLHGAMFAVGHEDAEGEIVTRVRAVVGDDPLIAASFDLHGNFSPRMARGLDLVTAYRTAPHIDIDETRLKAVATLAKALRQGQRPVLVYVPVPLAISGEMSNTADEPAKSMYSSVLHEFDGRAEILDCSILIGYVWADEARSGSSVLVTAFDESAASSAASAIAVQLWKHRADFKFGVPTGPVDDILKRAVEDAAARPADQRSLPVVISDSGDNPTAGGVGDVPTLIERLVALGIDGAVCQGPVDAAAVAQCIDAGVGATVSLSIGGKLDTVNATPLDVTGTVVAAFPEPFSYPRPGGGRDLSMPAAAVVRIETAAIGGGSPGAVLITLTADRKPFHYEADFLALNLHPTKHPILIVKIGYLVPDLERLACVNLMALSPGAVYADVATMPFTRIRRPIYPLDRDFDWEPSLEQ